jgi:hypothetical protein
MDKVSAATAAQVLCPAVEVSAQDVGGRSCVAPSRCRAEAFLPGHRLDCGDPRDFAGRSEAPRWRPFQVKLLKSVRVLGLQGRFCGHFLPLGKKFLRHRNAHFIQAAACF